ncbi:MAG: M10 family metallopeptidase C-terminal domain-containing protein [Bauldia litoralis]
MAIYNAGADGGNMAQAFAHLAVGIQTINITAGTSAVVTSTGGNSWVTFTGTGLTATGAVPDGGTYTGLQIEVNGPQDYGSITGIANAAFANVDSSEFYRILDGDDTLNGGASGDRLTGGGGGNDVYNGGAGNDAFLAWARSGVPSHTFNGGPENDSIFVQKNILDPGETTLDLRNSTLSSIEAVVIGQANELFLNSGQFGAGLSLTATVIGAPGAALHVTMDAPGAFDLSGLAIIGNPLVEVTGTDEKDQITGTMVADVIDGKKSKDIIDGGDGNDTLMGRNGRDNLSGGDGDDLLLGGVGRDRLDGGMDADSFMFDRIEQASHGLKKKDVIVAFEQGLDTIDLAGIDAKKGKKGNQDFKFIGDMEFDGKSGELRYKQKDRPGDDRDLTIIQGDKDGDGKADFALKVRGLVDFEAGDFVL